MRKTAVLVSFVFSLVLTGDLVAQSRPVEIGFDTGLVLSITSDKDGWEYWNTTEIAVPLQSIRVGFFVSDRVSIEPSVSFSYTDFGDESLTTLGLGAGVLYHFTDDATQPRFYIGGGAALGMIDVVDETETQFAVGVGLGVKLPIANRMAVRLEGQYNRRFESDLLPGANVIGITVGFSFFTS